MRTSPSFESQSSFEEFDSSTLNESSAGGTDDALEMDWGVVSTTGSDVGNYGQRSGSTSEYIGNGILILDGVDSNANRNDHSSDFSLPGTESLPSDIGSLSADNNEDVNVAAAPETNTWVITKRVVYLAGFAAFFVFSVVTGLFVHQHYAYRTTMQQLGEKIQQLEKEREEMPQQKWMDGSDIGSDSSFFTLLDNCWIKAKMNVKFGDCSQNSYGLCGAFFDNATKTIGKWFDETFPSRNNDEAGKIGSNGEIPSLQEAMETMAKFPEIMGEAIVSASKAVSDKLATLNVGVDEASDASDDLIRASEAFSEALHSAGGAMASELTELGDDPLKYLTKAVEGTSKPVKSSKFSMNGLRNVVDKLSSASIGWGEALVQTGEAISVKVVEIMDGPLSYFEFETKSSDEKDL
jgi:hypothetical protein